MIKLIDLLKEVKTEQSIIAKLSPAEQKQYEQALALLQDDTLDEGIKDSLKKLGLTAAVITALLATPNISQAKQNQLKDITPIETVSTVKTNPNFWVQDTNDIKKVQNLFKAYRLWTLAEWKKDRALITNHTKYYSQLSPDERKAIENGYMKDAPETEEDGKNGQYTSRFIFPDAFLKDLNTGRIEKLGLEGNEALSIVNKSGITINQMKDWNSFVNWMKVKGASGSPEMNHENFRNQMLQQYKGGGTNTTDLAYLK